MAVGEVGKVGVPVVHLGHMRTLLDGIPPGQMNTSMTINATAAWLLALYVANAEEQGTPSTALRGTTQNDIVKEYLSRGHVHLPARAVAPADRRHGRLVRRARAAVEPDERLLVPPPGGRGHAGAGAGLRAGHGDRRARRGARLRAGRARAVRRRCSARSRSSSTPASASSRRSASCGRSPRCGTASGSSATASTDAKAPPLPLRRAGQQPRPHRGPAGEQRAAHRARDARRSRCRSGPGPAASSCRRGTRRSACPARGTSSGRCGCNRCWRSRPTCSSTSDLFDGSHVVEARTAELRDAAQAELDDVLAAGRRVRGRRDAEVAPGVVDGRADPPHRVRRPGRRRRQPLHRDRAVAARRRRRHPARRPGRRGRDGRRRAGVAGGSRRRRRSRPRSTSCAGRPSTATT